MANASDPALQFCWSVSLIFLKPFGDNDEDIIKDNDTDDSNNNENSYKNGNWSNRKVEEED